jgi:hypothetical protein
MRASLGLGLTLLTASVADIDAELHGQTGDGTASGEPPERIRGTIGPRPRRDDAMITDMQPGPLHLGDAAP